MNWLIAIPLLLILTVVSIWDMRTKRIPNAFIVIGLIMGMTTSTIVNGWDGFLQSLLAFGISILVFIWFWGFVAAGDIKLLFVISTFVGVGQAFLALMLSFLLASVFLLVFRYRETLHSYKKIKYFLFYQVPMKAASKKNAYAYSPFILVSVVLLLVI